MKLTDCQSKALLDISREVVSRSKHVNKFRLLDGRAGSGKLQPFSAPVLTPEGFVPMRDIVTGSVVYGKDGSKQKVLEVYPATNLEIYKVNFCDGSSVECCIDHLWQVQTQKLLHRDKFVVKSLKEIISAGIHKNQKSGYRFSTPLPDAIKFDKQQLPCSPYLLGLLIGNGYLKRNYTLTMNRKDINEIYNLLLPLLPEGVEIKIAKFQPSSPNVGVISFNRKINTIFKDLGLHDKISSDKFIPSIYLISNVDDRLELLKGLMDTDGYINLQSNKTKLSYSTSSELLAENVQSLIRSLGGYSCLSRQDRGIKGIEYRVSVRLPYIISNLYGRKEKLKKHIFKFKYVKRIVSAEYVGQKDGQCILVDHPDHLYVCGDYTVTHNTTILPYIINDLGGGFNGILLLAPTNKAVGVIRSKMVGVKHKIIYKTLHGILYGAPDKNGEWIFNDTKLENYLVIVDECSMLDTKLVTDLREKFCKSYILFVGDEFQLEPIASANPLYDIHTSLFQNRLELLEVCRHDNGILETANLIRDNQYKMPLVKLNKDVMQEERTPAAMQLATLLNQNGDGVFLTATNKSRQVYNKILRQTLRKPEHIQFDSLIAVNNSNIMSNGEVFMCGMPRFVSDHTCLVDGKSVKIQAYDFEWFGDYMRLLFVPDLEWASLHVRELFTGMYRKEFIEMCGKDNVHAATGITKNVVVATWGYAISAHKSQGSQWENVFIDFDFCASSWNANRWIYTAITRASDAVKIINTPFLKFM